MSPKFKTIFHSIVFAYVYVMISLVIPTNFSVTAPNKSAAANTMIEIEGKTQSMHFRTMSVLTMTRISGFSRMLYEMQPQFEVEPLTYAESILTDHEMQQRGRIQKNASFEQSLITAYTLANKVDASVTIDYELIGMIIDFRSHNVKTLNIGDVITDIDNHNFTDYETMGQYFIETTSPMILSILRNNQTFQLTFEKSALDVFRFYPKYHITDSNPKHNIPGMNSRTTGPSAGMMYTLSIYYALTNKTLPSEDIAGTGTIRFNAEVGAIGGAVQKIYGAHKERIKYFIIPLVNYEEVKHLSHLMHIYPVKTIEEAIEVIDHEILS